MQSTTPSSVTPSSLLCACGVSYAIGTDVSIQDAAPFYGASGYTGTPTVYQGILPTTSACVLGVTANAVVLAFRGTVFASEADWLTDLMVQPDTPANWPGAVHSGFFLSLMEIMPQLATDIPAMMNQNPGLPLVITGHSKGGAMASMAAWYLQTNNLVAADQIYVTTFASPAAGTNDFATAFQQVFNQTNYINYLDIVPFLPPDTGLAKQLTGLFNENKYWEDLVVLLKQWNYTNTALTTYFIPQGGGAPVSNPFDFYSFEGALKTALENQQYSEILAAHSHACGGGYMNSICPGVCTMTPAANAGGSAQAKK